MTQKHNFIKHKHNANEPSLIILLKYFTNLTLPPKLIEKFSAKPKSEKSSQIIKNRGHFNQFLIC